MVFTGLETRAPAFSDAASGAAQPRPPNSTGATVGSVRLCVLAMASSSPLFFRVVAVGWTLLAGAASAFAQPAAPAAAKTPAAPTSTRELVLHKWSGTLNVPDPVACAVDPQGRVYVAATTRRKVGDLDIREHTMWIPDDVGFTSVEDKRAFYLRELAPGKMRVPRGMLKDHNADGSIDWKDLTHHTERIYQLRDTDGDGTADKMTVFAEGFNTEITGVAAGVLYHDGWVYVTIAPDLWRLKDTNDDGVADIREVVAHGFGVHIAYGGHDMHGPMVGPDGRIYWSIGDKGVNAVSKEGRRFSHPNEGAVMRVDPDGSNFEVYAHGLRNVQEPAFNEFGDLIGVDNDADQPTERERFVHIIEASDSGWRNNFQYMATQSPWMREGLWKPLFPGQAAYLLPPLESYSDGPAGFKFDPGTALGESQRGLFLLNEFPSGKLRGFRAERDGATFKMTEARVLNDGVMGIGMSWQPDGSLMVVDWVGGYPLDELGALWRVDTKDAPSPLRRETHALLTAGFTARPVNELTAQLGHADQRVRQGAQFELVRRGERDALLNASRAPNAALLARVHALWGYGQMLRGGNASAAAVRPLLQDADPEIRAQTAKVLGDAAATEARSEGPALVALLDDSSPRVRLQAALALAKFREPSAVGPLFALAARDGAVPALRHAAVTGLTGCATDEQLIAKRSDPSVAVRLASVVALRRRASSAITGFLQDADPLVVAEAARGIHDDTSIPDSLPDLAAVLDANPANEPTARRAINAGFRVGTPAAATRLLAYALNESSPRAMREVALTTLKAWSQPPRLDLVDGRARTLQPQAIAGVLSPKLEALLALPDAGLKMLAIEIMLAHRLKAGAAQIAAIVADAAAPGELRAQALRLLAGADRQSAAYPRALDTALSAESPAELHRAGLSLLLPESPDRLVAEAEKVLQGRTPSEQQHALALLARAGRPAADAVLDRMATALVSGTCPPALKLDVIEAVNVRSASNRALAAKLKIYAASAEAAERTELLTGGDVFRGRDLVSNHLAANCMACHSLETAGAGSNVGPNLRLIGNQRDAKYLLESLVLPSAAITQGFGIVNVTLKDKSEVTGTLATETPEAVTVRMFDGKTRRIARTEIANQTAPVSIMPPMLGILQPTEIRDVVAYLASLRTRPAPATQGGN
jgi:quinoprotein glucose dehydrogenase